MVAPDVGRHGGGHVGVDRQAGFHAAANFSGRYIDSARARQVQNRGAGRAIDGGNSRARGGWGVPLPGPREADEADEAAQVVRLAPLVELRPLVVTEEPEELRAGKGVPDFMHGVDGVRGRGAVELAAREPEAGFALEREAQQGDALGIGGARAAFLQRRLRARDEEDGVEPALFEGIAREEEVAGVDGVEGAAVKAESQARRAFHRSTT
jgi:hypothetical protein